MWKRNILFPTLLLGMILLFCQLPPPPPGPEDAKIDLTLKSFSGNKSNTTITDTVGNIDTIGVVLYLTQHIDSARVRVINENDTVHSFLCKVGKATIDTIFFPVTFLKPVNYKVIATGYISGQPNATATAVFHIVDKPIPNRAPVWIQDTLQISGGPAKLITYELKDKCSGPDSDNLTFSLSSTTLAGDTVIGSVFIVTPVITDTGKHFITIIAKDPPGLTDTLILKITISAKDTTVPDTVRDTLPPTIVHQSPKTDTVIDVDSFIVKIICTDESGIRSVQGFHDNTSFPMSKSVATENLWTGTIKGLSSGKYETIKLVATDSSVSKNKDSVLVHIKFDGDTVKPVFNLISPAKDSASTNSPDYTIKLKCTDTSGILSVNAAMDTSLFSGVRADSGKWIITIKGLTINAFNSITITATDSSLRANKKFLKLYIKYDPTLTDSIGPTIVQKSGPIHGTIIKDSIIIITDSITDPSGIDGIYWTINNVRADTLTAVAGSPNLYRLQDTLTKFRSNRIVVHTIDKSAARNRDSAVIVLDYNLPPQINDTAVATNRNTTKTWTLGARSGDSDTLFWSRLTAPSALSGSIAGTLPSVTFTPALNWSGIDSFYVRVSDGYWNDTAKIKVSVLYIAVAPAILTQPVSATKNIGQSVIFTVVINSDVNPVPTFQWKRNGAVIPEASLSSYTIGSVSQADSGSYTVTIMNNAGTITSTPVLFTINYAPSIITQPVSQVLYPGKSVTFSVIAKGNPAPNYVWRKNGTIIIGATNASYTISSPSVSDSGRYTVSAMNSIDTVVSDTAKFYTQVKGIATSANHTLFVKTDATLWACGYNFYGQLGNPDCDSTPKQIMTNAQSITAGGNHSLILKTDGTLWACGDNSYGQLGDGTTDNRSTPILIKNNVQSVAAGGTHSLILMTNGSLWACGINNNGQICDSAIHNYTAVPVLIMNNVQSIAAGANYSLIVKTDNTLWACGAIGDSTTIIPFQVMSNVKSISAGGAFCLILKTDGTLWAWGENNFGQLCDGTTTYRGAPKQVMTNIQTMSAGGNHSLLLKTDGTVWACGSNSLGELGDSTKTNRSTPVHVVSDVQDIAAGGGHSFFIKTNGSLWACGNNMYAELGDGNMNTARLFPVKITF
jgi:alpha-tubulin suppressor-like RCC1 family protein